MKIKYIIILSIATAILGFILGRLTIKPETAVEVKETIKYQLSEHTVRDTIRVPEPYETFVNDTIREYLTIVQEVDTAAILADYFLTRRYALDFSNDTIGTWLVDAEVTQNKLVKATSNINPMIKIVERDVVKYKYPAFSPFVAVGTNLNFNVQKISLGVDLSNKYIIGASGIRFDNNYNYTIDLGIKF